ncbi:MAG: Re/Si-specific NAD(P)(+) transhydrogenase subunit alpha [Bacteroidetes bacterium]|nr:Re/Si-specific NAD(P)(+) transhydrogenase subunit alpha [Bacteroidota bacterium]
MKIGTFKESKNKETRVALSPDVVKNFIKQGFECVIESGAGLNSYFTDEAYKNAGAEIANSAKEVCQSADVIVKINAPNAEEIANLKEGSILISLLYHLTNPELIAALNAKKISAFSTDAMPRISRAQSMDVLSSQSNLAGYKAVLLAADHAPKIFPMLMTAAGTITPARVVIFGAGVAGLQAIGTAKRLGAVVEVTDIRTETKEQIESLGGKFISFELGNDVKTEGGYVKEAGEEVLKRQREILKKHLATADCVITTALIPGRKAPVLITEEMVDVMKFGSVIVDMAVEQGGNCELSKPDEIFERKGVKIIGLTNLPGMLPQNASEGYSKNIYNFLTHLATKEGMKWELEEEITKGTLICNQGEILRK